MIADENHIPFTFEAKDIHVEYAGCGTHALEITVFVHKWNLKEFKSEMRKILEEFPDE